MEKSYFWIYLRQVQTSLNSFQPNPQTTLNFFPLINNLPQKPQNRSHMSINTRVRHSCPLVLLAATWPHSGTAECSFGLLRSASVCSHLPPILSDEKRRSMVATVAFFESSGLGPRAWIFIVGAVPCIWLNECVILIVIRNKSRRGEGVCCVLG